MLDIKKTLFLSLTPRQKSQLLGTLKSYFKKFDISVEDLIYKFLEDEKYYLDMGQAHFEFVKDYLDNEAFFEDIKKYFKFLEYEKEQKAKMEPYIERQKELAKQMRKKAWEFKMSKLKPTKKQINYYIKLAKNHNVDIKDMQDATRLDLRNWIMEILDKYA